MKRTISILLILVLFVSLLLQVPTIAKELSANEIRGGGSCAVRCADEHRSCRIHRNRIC